MVSSSIVLAPEVKRIIRIEACRAWRSLRRFGFERKDLRQEFSMRLLEGEAAYDPRRASPPTFAAHVCRHRGAQLLETINAAKRGGGVLPASFSEPVGRTATDDHPLVLADVVSEDGCAVRTGGRSRSASELAALRLDVDRTVAGLPVELAQIAGLLASGETVGCIAKLGISRSTASRRIAQLRSIFQVAGLDKYVIGREVI